jgi:hypothetical protein
VNADESLTRAEELLARLEAARAELEQLSADGEDSSDRAIELLGELSELAKAVEEELEKAQRAALEAPPDKPAAPGGEDRPASGGPGADDA